MILKLIKDELEYIQLINESTKKQNLYTTQLALILVEQVKFLISKEQYKLALEIAKTILILPLDFDCWFYLALSYILVKDVENALLVINSLPIIINKTKEHMIYQICLCRHLLNDSSWKKSFRKAVLRIFP